MVVLNYIVGMCGRATYKLTWEEIVALYRLTPDQAPVNTRTRSRHLIRTARIIRCAVIRPAKQHPDPSTAPPSGSRIMIPKDHSAFAQR
jgi:hypothetical protein